MHIDPGKICFGLSSEQDKVSCALYLQLLGKKNCAELLAARLSREEIGHLIDLLGSLMRKHLSKKEYHFAFLGADHSDEKHPNQ